MPQLTDRQRKQIIAEAAEGATVRALAAKYGVSHTTITRIKRSDPDFTRKVLRKKDEIGDSILEHMEKRRPKINGLLDDLLEAMSNKDKHKSANLVQLATTLGILIDKFTARERVKVTEEEVNNLFDALKKVGVKGDLNAIPELQQPTESIDAVVED